jgi:putative Mn2+ efflux pump MntP
MAVKPKQKKPQQVTEIDAKAVGVTMALDDSGLDPQEEKMLDWILKGVVAFILGWLGLSILMVVGGFFGIWK